MMARIFAAIGHCVAAHAAWMHRSETYKKHDFCVIDGVTDVCFLSVRQGLRLD